VQLTFGPLEFSKPLPGNDAGSLFVVGTLHRSEIMRYDMRTREFVPALFGLSAQCVAFSRDGEWVTYISYPEATLWRSRADGSERLQLTFSPMRVLVPRWSPDAGQIAFMAIVPGKPWNIFLVSREGGPLQHLLPEAQNQADPNWSADGSSLVFGGLDIDNLPIRILNLKSKQVSILPGSEELYSPRWSPDGWRIAAITSRRPYRLLLFDRRFGKWTGLVSFEVSYPNLSHEGKYIYFLDWHYSSSFMESGRVSRVRLSDRGVESIVELKKVGRLTVGTIGGWIGLAPDDSPLLSRDISTEEIYAIRWQAP
jgi:Tol biopolymer transport system component